MNRLILNSLLLLILFVSSSLETKCKYFFYEVSTDSSKAYIFGSIHYGKAEWYPFQKYIEDAFSSCEVLVTEIDMNNISQFSFINRMFATDTIELRYKLKPENYQKVVKLLSDIGMDEGMIQKIRPWFIAFSLQKIELLQGNISSKDGVDLYFTKRANEMNMKTIGIEEIDFQLSLLEKFDCCADEIIENMDKNQESEDNIPKLIDSWIRGDDFEINKMINEVTDASPEYQNVLHEILYKRNETMANSIEKLLENPKKYFVVIGAAHLVGEYSIINYLNKKSKFKIKRL